MSYSAKIIADSVSPQGVRLTTMEVEYPHAVHKDIMTHCAFERNFLSFRAFPPERVIEMIREDPFMPEAFATRTKGMGQGEPVKGRELLMAQSVWNQHREHAIRTAEQMLKLDLAKQQINFVLQDHAWIRGIITATHWENFWALRAFAPEGAKPRPEVERIALMMHEAYVAGKPRKLNWNEWHVPYVTAMEKDNFDYNWPILKKISTGRCARISYLTHDGFRDAPKDQILHDGLLDNGHMSPFGHIAKPRMIIDRSRTFLEPGNISGAVYDVEKDPLNFGGKFYGWDPYRKEIPNEDNFGKMQR